VRRPDDRLNPYAGGPSGLTPGSRGVLLGIPKTIELFAARNGCESPRTETLPSVEIRDSTRVEWRHFERCSGPPVEAYVIHGGGHTWPGGRTPLLIASVVGKTSRQLDASERMAAFFDRCSR